MSDTTDVATHSATLQANGAVLQGGATPVSSVLSRESSVAAALTRARCRVVMGGKLSVTSCASCDGEGGEWGFFVRSS